MDTSLEKHNVLKQRVLALINKGIDVYDGLYKGTEDENEKELFQPVVLDLSDLKDITEKGNFSIVVVGEFSAGKSTFLNALMGQRFLPSESNETTATINCLRSVKESPTGAPLVKIYYKDGTVKEDNNVSLDVIEKYVSNAGNDEKSDFKVVEKIERVDLFLDSIFLNDGVSLVDSPGLNGVLKGHKEVTEQQMKRSHAAIFMFDANQPGRETDFNLLKMLFEQCESILFVLNRIDQIKTSENTSPEKVIGTIKKNFSAMFPNHVIPEIWPISAAQALVARNPVNNYDYEHRFDYSQEEKKELLKLSCIEQFEQRLLHYITHGEKVKKELSAPVEKIQNYANRTRNTLKTQIDVLKNGADLEKKENERKQIESEIDELNERIGSSKIKIDAQIGTFLQEADDQITNDTRIIKSSYLSQLKSITDLNKLKNQSVKIFDLIKNDYTDVYFNALNSANEKYKNLIRGQFAEFIDQIEQSLNGNTIDKSNLTGNELTLDISSFDVDLDLEKFIAEQNQLERELLESQKAIDSVESDVNSALKERRNRERIRQDINETKNRYNNLLTMLGERPQAIVTTDYEKRLKREHFWSSDEYEFLPVQTIDDSNGKKFDDEKRQIIENMNKELGDLQRELKKFGDADPDDYQFELKKWERKKKEYEDKLKKNEEKKEKFISQKMEEQLEAVINDIECQFNKFDKESRDNVIDRIKELRTSMNLTATKFIEKNLENVLTEKQTELNTIVSTLKSDKETQEKSLKSKEEYLKLLNGIILEGDEILDEITDLHIEPQD